MLARLYSTNDDPMADVQVTGFNIERQSDVAEISWVTAADDDSAAGYVVELVDALGWVTRVGSDGHTERLTEQRVEVERPVRSAELHLSLL